MIEAKKASVAKTSFEREEVLADYEMAFQSRQASLIGRREVLSGKAKFGIFGDGKEVADWINRYALQVGQGQPAERFWIPK